MRIVTYLICLGLAVLSFVGTVRAQSCEAGNCPGQFTARHVAGTIAPVDIDITYSTVTYDGKCWITQNLGATQQADSATDPGDAVAGWYWQFNRKQGYSWNSSNSTRTPNTTWITSIDESSDWLAENDPCTLLLGSGWHIPTNTDWSSADVTAGGNWLNVDDAYASDLKLHSAGYLFNSNGTSGSRGTSGIFWSSKQSDSNNASRYYVKYDLANTSDILKEYGFSLRCCKTL